MRVKHFSTSCAAPARRCAQQRGGERTGSSRRLHGRHLRLPPPCLSRGGSAGSAPHCSALPASREEASLFSAAMGANAEDARQTVVQRFCQWDLLAHHALGSRPRQCASLQLDSEGPLPKGLRPAPGGTHRRWQAMRGLWWFRVASEGGGIPWRALRLVSGRRIASRATSVLKTASRRARPSSSLGPAA